MARGRFISSSIITDRQINDLSNDTCRLAYTWAITLADREGRVTGEPDLLLAQLFPRRISEIKPSTIEGYIREWVDAGFVTWYEGSDGDRVLQFVNFEKHQVGLRKEREQASAFDAPDDCRIIDGHTPEQIPVKLIKDNLNNNNKVSQGNLAGPQQAPGLSPGKPKRKTPEQNAFNQLCLKWELDGIDGRPVLDRLQRCQPRAEGDTLVLLPATADDAGWLEYHAKANLQRQMPGIDGFTSIRIQQIQEVEA